MSAFRDLVENDIMGVFLNTDEFADVHTWNAGRGESYEITAVVDDDVLFDQLSPKFEMLEKGDHMLFAKASQFQKKPKAGDVVRFDSILYTVMRVDHDMGMYTIFLSKGKA